MRSDTQARRQKMVEEQLMRRDIRDRRVLEAMNTVPRERFVPTASLEHAYEDRPIPIGYGQTISQPYVVALMIEQLELEGDERVLEIGAGSGYAAAVLGELSRRVYAVERHGPLAERADRALAELPGTANVTILHGDGTKTAEELGPFDAILVSAGGPAALIDTLCEHLAPGGRLIAPVSTSEQGQQQLVRAHRAEDGEICKKERVLPVQFVPLIGAHGWQQDAAHGHLVGRIERASTSFDRMEDFPFDALIERIGDARVVLLGEMSHGTAEFYDMRAQITRALVERANFRIVAVEADWPDAAHIDRWIRRRESRMKAPFERFPTWMWRNRSIVRLAEWMRAFNDDRPASDQVGFHGLDLYSMYASIEAVLSYLDEKDSKLANLARERYACLGPWVEEPSAYGGAVWRELAPSCAEPVQRALEELLEQRVALMSSPDGETYLDAVQNARLVANAETYYRAIYQGAAASWNVRDRHMFETLQALLKEGGSSARAIVWAHNSHVGDASATEFADRAELNIGQLCRDHHGDDAYLLGFGTHHGEVAAASSWGGEMQLMSVRPSLPESYGALFHACRSERFTLPLRHAEEELRRALADERLERAIGVIYRPQTERMSHYFRASLPAQFDEFVWFDETRAVEALTTHSEPGAYDTFPFGL